MVGNRLKYVLSKSNLRVEKVLLLKPVELLDRFTTLVPPPRYHWHFYHGVLASNSPLRVKIRALAGKEPRLARPELQKIIGKEDQTFRDAAETLCSLINSLNEEKDAA